MCQASGVGSVCGLADGLAGKGRPAVSPGSVGCVTGPGCPCAGPLLRPRAMCERFQRHVSKALSSGLMGATCAGQLHGRPRVLGVLTAALVFGVWVCACYVCCFPPDQAGLLRSAQDKPRPGWVPELLEAQAVWF